MGARFWLLGAFFLSFFVPPSGQPPPGSRDVPDLSPHPRLLGLVVVDIHSFGWLVIRCTSDGMGARMASF